MIILFFIKILEIFLYLFENRWDIIKLNILETLWQIIQINILVIIFCDWKKKNYLCVTGRKKVKNELDLSYYFRLKKSLLDK